MERTDKPPGSRGRLVDPDLRRLRYLHFVNDKISGLTDLQIAEKWSLDRKTVQRTLSWGKRHNIIADAEDDLLQTLYPQAQKVILQALEEGDVGVAMKIYDKVVKGRDAKPGAGATHDEDELAIYMAKRRLAQEQLENTTEGELLSAAGVAGLLVGEADDGEPGAAGSADAGEEEREPAEALAVSDPARDSLGGPPAAAPSEAPVGEIDSETGATEPRNA